MKIWTCQNYPNIDTDAFEFNENVSTKNTEVILFAFAYKLFHEDFSPIYGAIILNLLPSSYTLTYWGSERVVLIFLVLVGKS